MRAKSPGKRAQEKPVMQPTYRVETERNPETTPQYFQISVNVLEARKLTWLNPHSANSYVIVVLDKKKQRTSIRRNMVEPCYREYFMFELYQSIRDIQRSTLWLAVMEPRCCAPPRLMGESTIDLASIWSQPHHQVFHKWAQLSLPRNPAAGAVGFLKVDISILFRGDVQLMPVVANEDKVEDNLLLPTGSEQQPANYTITVYGVFGLPNGILGQGDNRRFNKQPSSFVRVSFCGLSAQTAVQVRSNHPTYCEQISIVEMFPNMSELIKLEVCCAEGCFNRVMATAFLQLGQISHDGENGFLPTFGPSLLHMYGNASGIVSADIEDGPHHRGAMLVSLRMIVPYYQQELRSTSVEPVVPLNSDSLWMMDDFCIFCPILEVSMLDRKICGKTCGVAMTVGESPTDNQGDEEFVALMSEIKNRKLYYTGALDVIKCLPAIHAYLDFDTAFPVLQLATRLPDFRFRVYRNNMVYGIVHELEISIKNVESRLKNNAYNTPKDLLEDLNRAAEDAAGSILKYLDLVQSTTANGSGDNNATGTAYTTELDQKQLALQREEAEKIYHQIMKRLKCGSTVSLCTTPKDLDCMPSSKKDVKHMISDLKSMAETLKNLIFKTSEGWPDIVMWILNGGSRVAYYRVSIADVIFSVIPEQNGKNCGRIQTIYLKPLKCLKHINNPATCHCIAGKVELILWMGLYRQMHSFEMCLPKGYKIRVKDFDMCLKTSTMVLECRAFIYRAKLIHSMNRTNQSHMFVRINAINSLKETKLKPNSMMPTWNQVLKIRKQFYGTLNRLVNSPPTILAEVIYCDVVSKRELVGRVEIQPVVEERLEYEYAPKLQWYDIYRGTEYTGQLLMSAQFVQVPEVLLKNTVYSAEDPLCTPGGKEIEPEKDEMEYLPPNLIPKSTTYKVDIYWWGLREVTTSRKPCVVLEIDDLLIKSDVVSDKKSNCNFPNGKCSHTFESPLSEVYSPPLSIRLYDSSTFGRTLFLGTNIVKNPSKYIVDWLPNADREACLRNVAIDAPNFFQVNQALFVKKSSTPSVSGAESRASSLKGSIRKERPPRWKTLFNAGIENEEEYALLPICSKENHQLKVLQNCPEMGAIPDKKDWWTRYYASVKDQFEDISEVSERIVMYQSELETQPEFSKFKDWCTTLKLYNGKKIGIPEKDEQLHCGFLKAGIAIYKWPPPENITAVNSHGVELNYGYFSDYPSNEPAKFLVRVYVVRGINLVAKAFTGKLDPYVAISCGNKQLGDRKSYVKNTLNPIFGKMYEFRCTLPDDYLLTVSLYDYDTVPPDELIGSTTVDLEDRIFTKHRARVGLASKYNSTGPKKWRDCCKPSAILEELCEKNHLMPPLFPDSATVIFNGVEYRDNDNRDYKSTAERKENICLSLLQKWHTLPICGYHLVPEHVETRTLFNSDKPGFEQGKLHMWVDIFPLETDVYVPPALDITPRKLGNYELRVIIWDVQGIQYDENGDKVTDIYIRAWIDTIEHAQYTEVYYKGSEVARFNSRMIFHFQYHHAEKKLVRKEKGPFTEVEEHFPPIFVVQVLNNDSTVPENFLGSCSFNLNAVPKGAKTPSQCKLEEIEKSRKINLFRAMTMRAWWPLIHTNRHTGMNMTVGIIDLELTLLPKEKAILMPVGLGTEPPRLMPKPVRLNIFRQSMDKSKSSRKSSDIIKNVKKIKAKWQREHTMLLIGAVVLLLLLIAAFLQIPQILWDQLVSAAGEIKADEEEITNTSASR